MSKEQLEASAAINRISTLLGEQIGTASTEKINYGCFNRVYKDFIRKVHHELPLSVAHGTAVATAACIPVWELLNFYSGILGPLRGRKKAFAIQLLTSLYAKTKDRRCLCQQLSCCGSNSLTSVPLSLSIPVGTEQMEVTHPSGVHLPYREAVDAVRHTVNLHRACEAGPGVKKLQASIRVFIEDALPHCELQYSGGAVGASSFGSTLIALADRGDSYTSGRTFLTTIWKYIISGELYCSSERRELCFFLSNSNWAQRTFLMGEKSVSYSTFLSPFVDAAMVCLSVNCRTSMPGTENALLIDPRIMIYLVSHSTSEMKKAEGNGDRLAREFTGEELVISDTSVVQSNLARAIDGLSSNIQQEVEFSGSSSTCRDCDQLTYFTRRLLFAPIASGDHTSSGVSNRILMSVLFNRKRRRDGGVVEGPVLVPVASSLTDMLGTNGGAPSSTLERLALAWK